MNEEHLNEEQIQKKKKTLILSIVCTVGIVLIAGISYAFWQKTKTQENPNVIATKCFDISLSGKNAIDLPESYPLSDDDGMQTLPFTFTIENICDYKTSYTVNLESLAVSTLSSSSIKVALEDNYKLYSLYTTTDKHFPDSVESRILTSGVLSKGESKTYNLRIWIDKDAPSTEQNKRFESKIVINSELAPTKNINNLKVGDYISMTPTSTSYTVTSSVTGNDTDQTINPSELNLWRVIKKNDNGTVDVVSANVSSGEIIFKGEVGYLNLVGTLNDIASQYGNTAYVSGARSMGFSTQSGICEGVDTCLADTGYETDVNLVSTALGSLVGNDPSGVASSYWIASRNSNDTAKSGRFVNTTGVVSDEQLTDAVTPNAIRIRPILTLKSNLKIASGDGSSVSTAYTLE